MSITIVKIGYMKFRKIVTRIHIYFPIQNYDEDMNTIPENFEVKG